MLGALLAGGTVAAELLQAAATSATAVSTPTNRARRPMKTTE